MVLSTYTDYFLLLHPVTYMRPVRRVRQIAAAIRIISQRRKTSTSRPPVNHGLAKVAEPREALVVPVKNAACLISRNALENQKEQQCVPTAAIRGSSRDGLITGCIPKQMAYPLIFRVVDRRVLGAVSQAAIDTIEQPETESNKVMSRALVPRAFGRLLLQNERKETAQHSGSAKVLPRIWPEWNTSYTAVQNTSCYVEDVSEDALENDGYYEDNYDEYESLWSPSAVRTSNRLEHVLYRLGMLEKLQYMFQTSECCESYYESDEYSEDDSEDYSGQYRHQGPSAFNSFLEDDFPYSNVHVGTYGENANGFEGSGEDFMCNATSGDRFSSGFSEFPFAGDDILEQVLHRVRKVQDFAYMFPSPCSAESESEYDDDITSEEDILLECSEDEELQISSEDYSDYSLSLEEEVDSYKTYVSEHYDYVDMQCSPQKGLYSSPQKEALGNGTAASSKAIPTAQSPTKPIIKKSNCAHHRVDSLMRSESLDSAESIAPRPESVGVNNEMSILAGLPCATASRTKNRTPAVPKIPVAEETGVCASPVDEQARDTTSKVKRPAPKQRVYTWEEKGKAIAEEAVESFELTDDEKAILAYIHKKDAERYPDGPPCCSKDVPHLKKKVHSKTPAGGQDDFPDCEFIPTGFNKFGSIEGDLILSGGMDMEEQKRRWDELTASHKEPSKHNSKPKEDFDMELEGILSTEEIEDQKRMYEEISRAYTRKTTNDGLTQDYRPIR